MNTEYLKNIGRTDIINGMPSTPDNTPDMTAVHDRPVLKPVPSQAVAERQSVFNASQTEDPTPLLGAWRRREPGEIITNPEHIQKLPDGTEIVPGRLYPNPIKVETRRGGGKEPKHSGR